VTVWGRDVWQRGTVSTEILDLIETLKQLMMLLMIVMMTMILPTAALCIL